jgi:predicted transcriptional regulator
MKPIVRQIDKEKCLELLSDHQQHTTREIEAATGNWFVVYMIQMLRRQGHIIKSKRIGRGVCTYKLARQMTGKQENLFE